MDGHRAHWRTYVILILTLLILLAVVSLVGSIAPSAAEPALTNVRLSGTIYISVTNANTLVPEPRVVDVATGKIITGGIDATSLGDMQSFSNDGDLVTFLGTSESVIAASEQSGDFGSAIQVYRASVAGTNTLPTPDSLSPITQDDSVGKFTPVINNDGTVLYVTATSSSPDHSVEPYSIHLVSATSSEDTILFNGIDPIWYDSNSFLYIAPDGIRLYNLETKGSVLLFATSGQDNFKIALSPNGQMLAFSDPDAGQVFLFDLPATLSLTLFHTFQILGFWAVFSPDNQTIAIQTATSTGTTTDEPALAFFNLATFEPDRADISLNPYLNDRLFVTAWR